MPSGVVLGLQAVTALNSGTTADPVWSIMTNIKDESINMETSLSDITNRAAKGWRLQVGTLSDATIDSGAIYQAGGADTEFNAIRDAFLNKSRVLMGFFDGDPDGDDIGVVSGLIGGFSVTNWTIGRQLEEAMMVDLSFTAREDDAGDGPQWIEIDTDTP